MGYFYYFAEKLCMISILIPVYNCFVEKLVNNLHTQCSRLGMEFEIIVFDDCSFENFKIGNAAITNCSNVIYKELHQNISRAKIRNELAKNAKYPYLLFIDCDAEVISDDYIQSYINNCNNTTIICGGISYSPVSPTSNQKLRWKYGRKREMTSAQNRAIYPYKSFTPFNFFTPKILFEKIKFNEDIQTYGHEDTLFGFNLKKKNIPIKHINNPLQHNGLDTNEMFLIKTQDALRNLYKIKHSQEIESTDFANEIKILRHHKVAQTLKIDSLLAGIYNKIGKFLGQRVIETKWLLLYDFYRICFYCNLEKNQAR